MRKCPFCGNAAKLTTERVCYGHGDYATEVYGQCTICGARGKAVSDWDFKIEECKTLAKRAWNNRRGDGHG